MKLIITIPKDKYCYIQELEQDNTDYATTRMLYHAVKHGKPLERGKWISEKVDGEDWKGCERQYYQPISCSKCHSPNHYKSTYCPNCGAKMAESEDEE
jgi:hypothetical protein